jgi:hypothetical protein
MAVPNADKGNVCVSAIINAIVKEDFRGMLRRGFGFADWVRGNKDPGSCSPSEGQLPPERPELAQRCRSYPDSNPCRLSELWTLLTDQVWQPKWHARAR